MSSFLLCWQRDGAALPAPLVAIADAHRATSGPVPPRRHVHEGAGAWHWQGDWAPGAEDELPLVEDGWLLAGTLRLDAREALAARLRDRGREPRMPDDAALAMASFQVRGEEAPREWIGDFAVAALAPSRDRLVVARGITGVRACFVLVRGALTCASDDLALLVRLAGGRGAPDDRAIAEYLRHGQLVSPALTFHRGIQRVPAAHTVVVERDGRLRSRRHWEYPTPEVRATRSDEAIVEEFRHVLGLAVADRLRAPRASILLSGGLDSPALAVEARRVAPQVRLHALTASWERLVDDPEPVFARAVARTLGVEQTVHRFAPDEGLPGGDDFRTPEPVPDVEPRLWRAQAARLAAHAPVVLNGEDVDALLSPPTLVEQLAHGGVGSTFAAWSAYRLETGTRPWAGVRRSLQDALGRTRRHMRGPRPPAWLRAPIAALGAGPAESGPAHPTRAAAVRQLRQPTWDATCWLDDPVMSGADLVVLLPFMDPRVIEVCFALPPVPWLQRKHLLRRAYEGLLPPSVLTRAKTPVQGYYEARVRVWREAGAPAPLAASVEEWVDPAVWRETLAHGTPEEVWTAWRVLELARWLAQEPT